MAQTSDPLANETVTAKLIQLVDRAHSRPFQSVVACVDFTSSAREVVEPGRRLAALGANRVDFLHVYDPPWHRLRRVLPALASNQDMQQQYLNTLQRQLRDCVGAVELPCRQVLQESPQHGSGIAAYAKLHEADRIVLAAAADGPLPRGGVAARAAPGPPYRRLVVAVDGAAGRGGVDPAVC